jgi:hypothetical protein
VRSRSTPRPKTPESQPSQLVVERLFARLEHLENLLQDKVHDPNSERTPVAQLSPTSPARAEEPAVPSIHTGDPKIDDAATVLEFLAWGRRKDHDFHDAPENESGPRRHSVAEEELLIPGTSADSISGPQLDLLEILLPSKEHIYKLVEFHGSCLLWYHGSYMALVFRDELDTFYSEYQGQIRHPDVNMQWLSLLFAILTGSMTCASTAKASSWGFEEHERASLSKHWYNATKICLNLSNYMEVHTIYSVEAISTLTISAHILGFSNTQSILLATATRLAQSLGIHRLGEEDISADVSSFPELKRRRRRETGRRLWIQLCTQDWFSIPFSESYSLNTTFFSTAKPLNCSDEDMSPCTQTMPTITSYCNYLFEIAMLIPQLQDAMASSNTPITRYEQVLLYDEKMRKLATEYMPTFLFNAPVSPTWPVYVPWARRSLAICLAHKIIMIHRKFLGLSFTNSAFAFTRRTCIAAAKTILKEARAASDESGPVLWIDQAFVVAAGIILCLDAFHRKPNEAEYTEHKKLGEDAIVYLSIFTTSMIAARGIKLLSFLTAELATSDEMVHNTSENSRKRANTDGSNSLLPEKRTKVFNLSSFIRSINASEPPNTPAAGGPESAVEVAWDIFQDMFPPQTGLGGENLFNNFFEFEL